MSPTGNLLRLNTGIQMHYQRTGQGMPALVFLHGGGGWGEHWQLQVRRFSTLTTVLTCDLRGHGRSDTPRGRYSIETFTDDVRHLLHQLEVQRPILVGHSLGGSIVLRYAFDFPDEVAGIVVVDSGCRANVLTRDEHRALVVARVRNDQEVFARYRAYRSSPRSGRADFVEQLLAATPAVAAEVIDATHYGIITHCDAAAASFLTCPVLVIGACDMDYWPDIQAWSDYTPHARIIGMADCGHFIMLEQPERFDAELKQFLLQVRAGSAPSGGPRETPPGCI